MTTATSRQVHVDAALTNISVMLMQSPDGFVFDKVFPIVPVQKQSDKYFIFDRADAFRGARDIRAPGTEATEIKVRLSTDSYFADAYALKGGIPDPVRANQDPAVDIERATALTVAGNLKIGAELNWVDKFFKQNVWATDLVGGVGFEQFSNFATSDPFTVVSDAKAVVKRNTGYEPNKLVIGDPVARVLKRHPLVLDRFKYTSSDSITNDMLARLFEVNELLVASAVHATSAEGAATPTFDWIAGKHMLLAYVPPAPGIMTPATGYTFVWSGLTGLNSMGLVTKNYREERLEMDWIESSFAYDQKMVGAYFGYFFANAVA